MKTKASDLLADLQALTALALTGLPGCPGDIRSTARPGEYPVDLTVHLKGVVKVGEDNLVRQVNKVHPWALVALLADKVNRQTLEQVIGEAVALANDGKDPENLPTIKAMAEQAMERIAVTTVITRKGAVKFAGQVEEVVL